MERSFCVILTVYLITCATSTIIIRIPDGADGITFKPIQPIKQLIAHKQHILSKLKPVNYTKPATTLNNIYINSVASHFKPPTSMTNTPTMANTSDMSSSNGASSLNQSNISTDNVIATTPSSSSSSSSSSPPSPSPSSSSSSPSSSSPAATTTTRRTPSSSSSSTTTTTTMAMAMAMATTTEATPATTTPAATTPTPMPTTTSAPPAPPATTTPAATASIDTSPPTVRFGQNDLLKQIPFEPNAYPSGYPNNYPNLIYPYPYMQPQIPHNIILIPVPFPPPIIHNPTA